METYKIQVKGQNIRVTEWGKRVKPVIFCLHGLGSTRLSFIEIAESLLDDFRIIAVDAPGHGETDAFEDCESYNMHNMARWIDHVIGSLGLNRFYFLSHSWGSFVALFYLLKQGNRVKGSMLIDGGYQTKRLKEQTLDEELDFYKKDFDDYVFPSWESFITFEQTQYSRWSSSIERAVGELGVYRKGEVRWHVRGETAMNIIRAMHQDETEDIYHLLRGDIVLLKATEPKAWSAYRDKTSKVFADKTGATIIEIPESTHLLHWDHPNTIVNEIKNRWIT